MPGGYMGRILEVNLSTGDLKVEQPDEGLLRDYIGGYGIGARILYSRMKPGADPLGPDNILGFATGPLTGTQAAFGNRYTVFCKSPLTGGWGDANSGGEFGPAMKFAGFDAVLISGISDKPVYLLLDNGKASLKDASHLWGRDSNETEDILREEIGKRAQVACIGPAGEQQSLIACVMNNKGRAAGRSGIGAVMGSKNLKAIVAKGNLAVPVADGDALTKTRREALKALGGAFKDLVSKWGTPGLMTNSATSGDAPVKNWGGVGVVDLPEAGQKLGGDATIAYQAKKYGCWRCPISCGGLMVALDGDYKLEPGAHKPEYETLAAFGTSCLNENIESIIVCNDICNRYGLDTISAGATIAFAIECYENGLIDKRDTEGIELTWGNHRAIVAMTEKLAKREGFGAVLADGVMRAAEKIGKNADDYAIHVGGQEVPMHDPRLAPRYFATYKFDATPGRHTQNDDNTHLFNAAGVCMFGDIVGNKAFMARYLAAVTGWDRSSDELLKIGERIHNLRHAFNLRQGINAKELKMNGRLVGIPPQTAGPLAGRSIDMDVATARHVQKRGWDPDTLKPTKEKLLDLGLDDVAEDLWG